MRSTLVSIWFVHCSRDNWLSKISFKDGTEIILTFNELLGTQESTSLSTCIDSQWPNHHVYAIYKFHSYSEAGRIWTVFCTLKSTSVSWWELIRNDQNKRGKYLWFQRNFSRGKTSELVVLQLLCVHCTKYVRSFQIKYLNNGYGLRWTCCSWLYRTWLC